MYALCRCSGVCGLKAKKIAVVLGYHHNVEDGLHQVILTLLAQTTAMLTNKLMGYRRYLSVIVLPLLLGIALIKYIIDRYIFEYEVEHMQCLLYTPQQTLLQTF